MSIIQYILWFSYINDDQATSEELYESYSPSINIHKDLKLGIFKIPVIRFSSVRQSSFTS